MHFLKKIYRHGRKQTQNATRFMRTQVRLQELFLGNSEYGGWTISPDEINSGSIVYSFGVGEDISWDLALVERFGMNVYAFDPTPRSIAWVESQSPPEQFHFYSYGIAAYDGTARFFPPENPNHVSHTMLDRSETSGQAIEVPVKRLSTIAKELGHTHIDILKMDIEGAEYNVIEDLLNSKVSISQVLVEFHHRWPTVNRTQTRKAIRLLNEGGYRIFHISPSYEEYAFIKTKVTN